MSSNNKVYLTLLYLLSIIHIWLISKTCSILQDTLTDNVNMVCPPISQTFQGDFVNRLVAYSFDSENGSYQIEGCIKSIDFSPANLSNNSFNPSNGIGFLYGSDNGNNTFIVNVTGNLYTDIENFDILVTLAYEVVDRDYELAVIDYYKNNYPYYKITMDSSSYRWRVYNAKFSVINSFVLTISWSGLGRLDDICLFQVCSEGFKYDYTDNKCKATSTKSSITTTIEPLTIETTEVLNSTNSIENGLLSTTSTSTKSSITTTIESFTIKTTEVVNSTNSIEKGILSTTYQLIENIATPLVNGRIIAILPTIEKEYIVSFDYYPNSFPLIFFYAVIRFTNTTGDNYDYDGYHIPGIYLHSSGFLQIGSSINGNGFTFFNTYPIALREWINIEISQILICGDYVYRIKLNGNYVYFKINYKPQRFNNVKVYASDSSWPSDGLIKNLYVLTGDTTHSPATPNTVTLKSLTTTTIGAPTTSGTLNIITTPYDPIISTFYQLVDNIATPLINGKVFTALPNIEKEYLILFDYYPNSFPYVGFYSVVRFTSITGFGNNNVSSVYLHSSGRLLIANSINGNGFRYYNTATIILKQWVHIELSQVLECGEYIYRIKLNDTTVYLELNYQSQSFNKITVYAADFTLPTDGFIKNFYVFNGNSNPCYYKSCYTSNYCNVVSGYAECSCPVGLRLQPDGITCVQDPCYYKNCYSLSYCSVVSGYAVCSCPAGLKLQSDGITCLQDPCYYKNCYSSNYCSVVSGFAVCSCPTGLKLQSDGITCLQDPCYYKNCYSSNYCSVVLGFAICSCPFGLKLQPDGITCLQDLCYYKSCYSSNYCSVISGFAICSCPIGLKLQPDGITCLQDQCNYKSCYNSNYCAVVSGVAVCSCPTGLKLQSDGVTCLQDPCYSKNCYTSNYCSVESGYAVCSCPAGLYLQSDGITCLLALLPSSSFTPSTSSSKEPLNTLLPFSSFTHSTSSSKEPINTLLPSTFTSLASSSTETLNKTSIIIVAALVAALVVLILIVIVVVVLLKRKKRSHPPMSSSNPFLQTVIYSNQEIRSNEVLADEWEIFPESFLIDKKIGDGAYGTVFLAKLYGNVLSKTKYAYRSGVSLSNEDCNVAVKLVKAGASPQEITDFREEINFMKKIGYHQNIVNMIGCSTVKKPLCLIFEFMENGDLLQFLRKRRAKLRVQNNISIVYTPSYQQSLERTNLNSSTEVRSFEIPLVDIEIITPKDLLSFAYQVATGMEYLSKIKVVHRDLSARNILVGTKKNIKISDFGLSRVIQNELHYMGNKTRRMPIKWMSIEALRDLVFTSSSDVWAYGVVLFEIVTLGGTPYPAINNHELLEFLKSGYRMDRPDNCSTIIYDIMLHCWNKDPLQRPTFQELRVHLEELLSQDGCYSSFDINEENIYYNVPSFNHPTSETSNSVPEVDIICNANITA